MGSWWFLIAHHCTFNCLTTNLFHLVKVIFEVSLSPSFALLVMTLFLDNPWRNLPCAISPNWTILCYFYSIFTLSASASIFIQSLLPLTVVAQGCLEQILVWCKVIFIRQVIMKGVIHVDIQNLRGSVVRCWQVLKQLKTPRYFTRWQVLKTVKKIF